MGQRLGLRVPNLIALLCAVHERVSVFFVFGSGSCPSEIIVRHSRGELLCKCTQPGTKIASQPSDIFYLGMKRLQNW